MTWYGVAYLFTWLVVGSSKYSAIYSGMAAAVLFIIWIKVGWLIILVGTHVARYMQHPHLLRRHPDGPRGERLHDAVLALDVMTSVGRAHYFDEPKWTLASLTTHGYQDTPGRAERLLQALQWEGLLVATNDEPEVYVPARAIETIGLREIMDAARTRGDEPARHEAVQEVIADIEQTIAGTLEGKTLQDLVLADKRHPAPGTPFPEETGAGVSERP